jgi:bile acid:Na+ symporter, BASS family
VNPLSLLGGACLVVAAVCLPVVVAGVALASPAVWQPAAVALSVALAGGAGRIPGLGGYRFTLWIVTAVVAAVIYPVAFLHWGPWEIGTAGQSVVIDVNLRNRWLMLAVIQLVMFGMGTHMHLRDLSGVASMPRAVAVGLVAQFSIMPIVGYTLTKIFAFPPEISAGIVLIGSCSSGLASNVITYLAKGNIALSITLTTAGTLLAPFLTPLWMQLLAGEYVKVDFVKMMMEVIKIVIVPVGAAMTHDYLRNLPATSSRKVYRGAIVGTSYIAALLLDIRDCAQGESVPYSPVDPVLEVVGYLFGAVVVGVVYHTLTRWFGWLDRVMPVFSMFGIVYFTAVTTAAGREELMTVGGLLFLAAVIHNSLGYLLGYMLARTWGGGGEGERKGVGGGGVRKRMAAGIAQSMGKLGTVGLPGAIFSPWMNVSGSILANYWRKRPVEEDESIAPTKGAE